MSTRRLPLMLALLLSLWRPASSAAQAPVLPVTAEILTIYRQGQSTPAVVPFTLSREHRVCDLPPTPDVTATVDNPMSTIWLDPSLLTDRECKWTDPGTGVLAMLADGPTLYEATLKFAYVDQAGQAQTTAESGRSNLFRRPGIPVPPAVPARVRVVRP